MRMVAKSYKSRCGECGKSFSFTQADASIILARETLGVLASGIAPHDLTQAIKLKCPQCGTVVFADAPEGFWD